MLNNIWDPLDKNHTLAAKLNRCNLATQLPVTPVGAASVVGVVVVGVVAVTASVVGVVVVGVVAVTASVVGVVAVGVVVVTAVYSIEVVASYVAG